MRPHWSLPLLALSLAGAGGCFILHAGSMLGRPAPLAPAVAPWKPETRQVRAPVGLAVQAPPVQVIVPAATIS